MNLLKDESKVVTIQNISDQTIDDVKFLAKLSNRNCFTEY